VTEHWPGIVAAALLRHPDLLAPVTDRHRAELLRALPAPTSQREERGKGES
jgi:hypothetical protein